ncbi:MAG: cytochrome c biogenesis protein ResB, partial [Dehalococcoidia bacterium]
EFRIVGRVWHFFTSVRLALILIFAITAAVFAGTMIDHVPPSVRSDPAAYSQWLSRVEGTYGVFPTKVFDFLELFNVFRTLWFRALLGLLTVNIIVCTLNRWKGIWRTAFPPRIRMTDAFFQHARFNARYVLNEPAEAAAVTVRKGLKHARYRVSTEAGEGSVALYADRNRFSRFGTFVSHLALVLILAGTVVGGMWGLSDPEFIVPEGMTRDVGLGTDLSVQLEHFTDEYYTEGPPKDFRSDIVILKGGEEVKRGTVRVNSPMTYDGMKFHQSFFGQTAVMAVKTKEGTSLYDGPVPLAWQTREGNRPVGNFTLGSENLEVWVIGPKSGENDPLVPAGEMRIEIYESSSGALRTATNLSQGTEHDVSGLNFTFVREGRFTGLSVVKDPGVKIVWVASALMIIGLVMLFYMPHRRLWASCKEMPDGKTEVRLAMTGQRDSQVIAEFERVRQRVGKELRGRHAKDEPEQGGNHV